MYIAQVMRNINIQIWKEAEALKKAKRNLWDGACIEKCQDGECKGGTQGQIILSYLWGSPVVRGKMCVIKKGGALKKEVIKVINRQKRDFFCY